MNPLHLDTPRSTSERTPDDIPADSPTQRVREEGHLPKIVKAESCDLLHVDGDRCVGVCFANDEGHVIHIDFGFMLSNSPGGVNFEAAPFKLTREYLEIMDSNSEGKASELFDYFKVP